MATDSIASRPTGVRARGLRAWKNERACWADTSPSGPGQGKARRSKSVCPCVGTMGKPKILLADDHRIVLEGLRGLLSGEFELVGQASDGRELVEQSKRLEPDVIVA